MEKIPISQKIYLYNIIIACMKMPNRIEKSAFYEMFINLMVHLTYRNTSGPPSSSKFNFQFQLIALNVEDCVQFNILGDYILSSGFRKSQVASLSGMYVLTNSLFDVCKSADINF